MKKGMQNTGCKLWSISRLIQNRFPINLCYMHKPVYLSKGVSRKISMGGPTEKRLINNKKAENSTIKPVPGEGERNK